MHCMHSPTTARLVSILNMYISRIRTFISQISTQHYRHKKVVYLIDSFVRQQPWQILLVLQLGQLGLPVQE